jgi:hypothetical protein
VELDPYAKGKLRKWIHAHKEGIGSAAQEDCTLEQLVGVLAEPTSTLGFSEVILA